MIKKVTTPDLSFDFGFSILDEGELKKAETQLQTQLTEVARKKDEVSESLEITNEKLRGIMKMIKPLLDNLSRDPEKHYIFWPNRVDKIKDFTVKLEAYIKS